MMIHLEGPVVDSVYDTLLLSWHETFNPVPPCIAEPSHYRNTAKPANYLFSDANPYLAQIDVLKAAKAARLLLARQNEKSDALDEEGHHREGAVPFWWRRPSGGEGGLWRRPSSSMPEEAGGERTAGGRFASLVSGLVERAKEEKAKLGGGSEHHDSAIADDEPEENHELETIPEAPSPTANTSSKWPTLERALAASQSPSAGEQSAVSRSTPASPTDGVLAPAPTPASPKVDEKASPAATPASPDSGFSSSPGTFSPREPSSCHPLLPLHTLTTFLSPAAAPGFSKIEPTASKNSIRLKALSTKLNAGALAQIDAAIVDEALIDDYKPHMIHRAHAPVPMAMVNRKPHGAPGHQDIRVPQDAAWLAGLRHAQASAFIQTPTLNARPVVRAIVEACSRGGPKGSGIVVTLILGLGFNDKGESVPFQGGTNEEVVVRLFKKLTRVGKQDNLQVYWYTGKDQIVSCKRRLAARGRWDSRADPPNSISAPSTRYTRRATAMSSTPRSTTRSRSSATATRTRSPGRTRRR